MVESTIDKWVVPLVSFSDAHSMPKIGREVSIFPGDPSFSGIKASLTEGTVDTIEYPPALGKYHYSGHRKCKFSIGVQDDLICDKCMRRVIVGVEQRVADIQKTPIERDKLTGERYMIPLADLIASMHKLQAHDDFVLKEYDRITRQVPEIELLTTNDLKSLVDDKQLKDLILEVRNRQVKIIPGYDGQFGKIVDIYPILKKWMEKANLLFMEKHDHKKAWEMAEAISAMMNSGEMAMSREEYEAINKGNKRPLR
jgi:PHP family Zn ribbon phosphoesterase